MFAGVAPRVTRRTLMAAFTWALYEQVSTLSLSLTHTLSLPVQDLCCTVFSADGFARGQPFPITLYKKTKDNYFMNQIDFYNPTCSSPGRLPLAVFTHQSPFLLNFPTDSTLSFPPCFLPAQHANSVPVIITGTINHLSYQIYYVCRLHPLRLSLSISLSLRAPSLSLLTLFMVLYNTFIFRPGLLLFISIRSRIGVSSKDCRILFCNFQPW